MRDTEAADSFSSVVIDQILHIGGSEVTFLQGDLDRARQVAADGMDQLKKAKTDGSFQASQMGVISYYGLHMMGRIDYLHGNYAIAEREERQALANRKQWSTQGTQDQRDLGEASTWLAMSLAQQGKLTDALSEIAPVVKFQRDLSARNHGDVWLPSELAAALYAQALADAPHRAALLKEAAALLDRSAPSVKPLRETRQWRQRVSQAQHG